LTAAHLRTELSPSWEIFDDWYAAGPEADDYWKQYEQSRGSGYIEALNGYAANHVFEFDKHHLDTSSAGILLLPAGRSGHLELGYLAGRGAYTAIVLTPEYETERFDVMYRFATRVTYNLEDIIKDLNEQSIRIDTPALPSL
jgi:hypothetical protein